MYKIINQIIGRDLNFKVQVDCPKEYLGTDYGGWWICPDSIAKDSIVYSLGVGEDISFDLLMIEKFGANVYAFDPTPRSIKWVTSQKLPSKFHFYECGIAGHDGMIKFYPHEKPSHVSHSILHRPKTAENAIDIRVRKLETVCNMLGHKKIDILKMDIEGAEYDVIKDIIHSDIEINQLLIEFHHKYIKAIGKYKTKMAIKLLIKRGFRIFDISPDKKEYSFISLINK